MTPVNGQTARTSTYGAPIAETGSPDSLMNMGMSQSESSFLVFS